MICMAGLQVFIVRFFFQGARKGKSLSAFGRLCELISIYRLCMSIYYGTSKIALSFRKNVSHDTCKTTTIPDVHVLSSPSHAML